MSSGAGSVAVTRDDRRRRRPWWLWLAVALAALALAIFGLSRCGADPGAGPDPRAGAGAGTAANGAPSGAAAPDGGNGASAVPPAGAGTGGDPAAGAAGAAGTLTADGVPMLPVAQVAGPDGALTGQVGKPVTAEGVAVQSVPANEGFWVGTGEDDRVWVQLTGADESGYVVTAGDRVQFTGTVVNHDAGFAGQVGVDPAEGADQLTTQAAHVEVAKSALRQVT